MSNFKSQIQGQVHESVLKNICSLLNGTREEMILFILNLNARIVVVFIIIVLVANLFISKTWNIVNPAILIPSNYSESTINDDIRNGLQDNGFRFFQCIHFSACCSIDTDLSRPYSIQGFMHIIEGDITIYITTRYM